MAAAANIVINDGASTPVAHTFVPARKNGQVVEYEERSTAFNPQGFYTLAISQSDSKGASPVIRTKVTLAVPVQVLDSSTGLYTYPAVSRISLEVLLPKSATSTVRSDISAYLQNLCAHATIVDLVKDLNAPF
jgi:hypothetical protein